MLTLSYDNQFIQDGIGAQALRIVTLFGISRYFRCEYVHSPILRIRETAADGFLDVSQVHERIARANEIFAFGTRFFKRNPEIELNIPYLTNKKFLQQRARSMIPGSSLHVSTAIPFAILKRFPQILNGFPEIIRLTNPNFTDESLSNNIVIHIRLGYGSEVTQNAKGRYLPIEYFIRILRAVVHKYQLENQSKIIIHTDVFPQETLFKVLTPEVREELQALGMRIERDIVRIPASDLSPYFLEFSHLDIEIKYCNDFFESLIEMSQAKILIMSRSALSYLAGAINPNIVIWPNNHGHPKLSWWKSSLSFSVDARGFSLIPG